MGIYGEWVGGKSQCGSVLGLEKRKPRTEKMNNLFSSKKSSKMSSSHAPRASNGRVHKTYRGGHSGHTRLNHERPGRNRQSRRISKISNGPLINRRPQFRRRVRSASSIENIQIDAKTRIDTGDGVSEIHELNHSDLEFVEAEIRFSIVQRSLLSQRLTMTISSVTNELYIISSSFVWGKVE